MEIANKKNNNIINSYSEDGQDGPCYWTQYASDYTKRNFLKKKLSEFKKDEYFDCEDFDYDDNF